MRTLSLPKNGIALSPARARTALTVGLSASSPGVGKPGQAYALHGISAVQPQQRRRVPPSELFHVSRRQRDAVEKGAALGIRRIGVVDREHDAVDAEGLQRRQERRRGEDAAGSDPDLLPDGLADWPL